uniref:Uncharacterized protein n=1 Tax=Populus alba TaxID=43335 RepID=A0A4U5QFE8_POPAL|nr:hypothetical protein D5086_0000094150 [Populus alba]
MASICQGKSSWPELLGVDGKCAVETIERENSLVEAIIVTEGSSVPENFACDRVWVWVDKYGIVYLVPAFNPLRPVRQIEGNGRRVFIRPAEAVAAVKRYNRVQLDGKPMKIEIVGANFAPPHANAAFGNSNGLSGRVRSRGGALVQLRGGSGGGRGIGRGRGRGRGCGEKVSAEDLDAYLEKFSNKLHLFCPVQYQFPDCFMTADAAHNSDCNLHLCFIQPDDVENAGGYRAWNMVCSWNDSGCGFWLNYTDEGELCTAFCILRSSCFCVRMQLVNP